MAYTNAGIVPAAIRGITAETPNCNFSTNVYEGARSYAPYTGHLPHRLAAVLNERFRAGAIRQVIYSYSTPIAWLDGDVWIRPDVSYSVTTSVKHQSQLYKLGETRRVQWDTPLDEYMRVLDGLMVYTEKGTRAA